MLTRKGIADKLEVSETTIREDIKYLGIEPDEKGLRGVNIYTQSDCDRISALREHCQSGKTRDSFLEARRTEIVSTVSEIQVDKTTLLEKEQALDCPELIQEDIPQDVIRRLLKLQILSDMGWTPPTQKLASILGISVKTLLKKRGEKQTAKYNYWGIICIPEDRMGNDILWRIYGKNS